MSTAVAIAAICSVVVSAGAVVMSIHGLKSQLWLQTFADYTKRYDAIVAALPSEARDPDLELGLDGLTSEVRAQTANACRSYLNLCSEEHYLKSRKRIDGDTWAIWATGSMTC